MRRRTTGNWRLATGNCRAGFTLAELLVAMFVLAMAVAGAVAVIMAAGRSAVGARDRLMAEELARTALADAAYTAEEIRAAHAGSLDLASAEAVAAGVAHRPADAYFLECYEKRDPRPAPAIGWVWRAHSFDPAVGAYSLDVWVFRGPADLAVNWGRVPNSDFRRSQTLFYLQSRLETRGP